MPAAPNPETSPGPGNPIGYKDRSLWLWVAAGFLLFATAWTALFLVARHAHVESVPLANQPGRT